MVLVKSLQGCLEQTYPFFLIEIQVLSLSVFKVASQADSVVCQMWFFSNNDNIVLPSLDIELDEFLTGILVRTDVSPHSGTQQPATYMKAMPTIPRPTTTTFFRLLVSGISSFASNSFTVSGNRLASGSCHTLLD